MPFINYFENVNIAYKDSQDRQIENGKFWRLNLKVRDLFGQPYKTKEFYDLWILNNEWYFLLGWASPYMQKGFVLFRVHCYISTLSDCIPIWCLITFMFCNMRRNRFWSWFWLILPYRVLTYFTSVRGALSDAQFISLNYYFLFLFRVMHLYSH